MGGKSQLNPNQRDAVESDENLLCCACPGSGKTSVLIAKVLHILRHENKATKSPKYFN